MEADPAVLREALAETERRLGRLRAHMGSLDPGAANAAETAARLERNIGGLEQRRRQILAALG